MGLDVICSVVWYQIGLGSPPGGEGKLRIKTTRKATGNYLAIFFLRHIMHCAIVSKDNSINEAISQGLAESCLAGNGVRHSRTSSSEILTTRVGRKKFYLFLSEPYHALRTPISHFVARSWHSNVIFSDVTV